MKRLLAAACLVLAAMGTWSAVDLGTAHASGPSGTAASFIAALRACASGGYANQFRQDGTAFKNTGECILYAVHGSQLASIQVTNVHTGLVDPIYGPYITDTVVSTGLPVGSVVNYTLVNYNATYPYGTVSSNGTVTPYPENAGGIGCGAGPIIFSGMTATGQTISTTFITPC